MSPVSSANRELKMKRHENAKPDLRPDYKILELNQVTITSNSLETICKVTWLKSKMLQELPSL